LSRRPPPKAAVMPSSSMTWNLRRRTH
jgi:hypothetical protein